MRNRRLLWVSAAVAGCLAIACATVPAIAAGPPATALVKEGAALPGAPEEIVSSINNSAVNKVGGYSFTVNTTGSGTTLSHAWGDALGGVGTVIRTEGTFGDYQQTSWESFFGMSNAGKIAYSPSCTHVPSGTTGLDGVWLDDTVVMIEEQAYPHMANWYWSFGSRPGVTADDVPHWVGGITDTLGGSTDNRGLFYGFNATPLLLGGDTVPDLPYVLSTSSTVSFDYRFSAFGAHYLAEAQMSSGSSLNDNAMVLDGQGLMLGGSLVREDSPLPAAVGGLPGEVWDNFDYLSVTEDGHWLMTGDSNDAGTTTDEFLMVDGQIILREGDTLPSGLVLASSMGGAFMNEDGDWAVNWYVNLDGTNRECIIVNGEFILAETFEVDWDGDGIPDENAILMDITGTNALTVGDRMPDGSFDVYFTGDVSVDGGSNLEAGFRITIPEPSALALLAIGALTFLRRR